MTLIYRRLSRSYDRTLPGDMTEVDLAKGRSGVSSHLIGFGIAQDHLAASESLPAIMQAHRWCDPKMVLRCGAKLAAKSDASALRTYCFGPDRDGRDNSFIQFHVKSLEAVVTRRLTVTRSGDRRRSVIPRAAFLVQLSQLAPVLVSIGRHVRSA